MKADQINPESYKGAREIDTNLRSEFTDSGDTVYQIFTNADFIVFEHNGLAGLGDWPELFHRSLLETLKK